MKQKLELIINKGKILALASLASLAINCQFLNQDTGLEVETPFIEENYNPIKCRDWSSVFPCGVKWSSSDGYGGTYSGVGTWCPPGKFGHEDPYNSGTFKCYPDIIMHKVTD